LGNVGQSFDILCRLVAHLGWALSYGIAAFWLAGSGLMIAGTVVLGPPALLVLFVVWIVGRLRSKGT
jgi:hypothetical protein